MEQQLNTLQIEKHKFVETNNELLADLNKVINEKNGLLAEYAQNKVTIQQLRFGQINFCHY